MKFLFDWRKWLVLPPTVVGVLFFVYLAQHPVPPKQKGVTERKRPVRTMKVPELTVVPRAMGYGTVRPEKVWKMLAEVAGKITYIHPSLQEGSFIREGTKLIEIDKRRAELKVAQMEASIENIEAQLKQLAVEKENQQTLLAIEESALRIKQHDLERQKQQHEQNIVSQSALEATEREVLTQRAQVQSLKNSLRLIPARKKTLQAQLDLAQAQLSEANLELENTSIQAPFNLRIEKVDVELAQFVQAGQTLAQGYGTDKAEVLAQLSIDNLQQILRGRGENPKMVISASTTAKIKEKLGITATVQLKTNLLNVKWPAEFSRVNAGLDANTRTVGVIVTVDNPYEDFQPGLRPPLVKGMFCEVELQAKSLENVVVIPRVALHGQEVYLVNKDNRLEKRRVEILLNQSQFVLIKKGVQPGEQIILSDVLPAIENMLLDPKVDKEYSQWLIEFATRGAQ